MKAKELRELTPEELDQKFSETQRELFNLRLQQAHGQIEKPSRLRDVRRDIARIQTIMSQRRIQAQQTAQTEAR